MKPIKRQALTDTVAQQLTEEIVSGRWPVDTRIPNETELCNLLEVSRGTMREAVRALVLRGLLETRQGSGTYVRSCVDPLGPVEDILHLDLRDLIEARTALEAEAARLAALRKTAAGIDHLRHLLAVRGEYEGKNYQDFIEKDFAFHCALVAMGKNQALIRLYDFFSASIRQIIAATLHGPLAEPGLEVHLAIVDAVESGDPHKAATAVRAFTAQFFEQLDNFDHE